MNSTEKNQAKHPASSLYDFIELLVIAVCTVLVLFSLGFRLCRVSGDSMNQTLHHNEMLFISGLAYTPEQGDIVVFHQTHEERSDLNEPIVKRVIATEGQTVKINFTKGSVTVDGKPMDGDFAYLDRGSYDVRFDFDRSCISSENGDTVFTQTVPNGKIFVLGDNRNHSLDSRSPFIGCVDVRRVLGEVVLRITPFSRFGLVD